jgi:sensor histidine kinase YesM
LLPRRLPLYLLAFGLLVGMGQALLYHWRWREREWRAAQLESQLVKAQLQTLKMQLHPHFLFNTLSHIVELIHTQPKAAEQMLIRLSELLRLALDARTADEAPLRQELAFLQKYLDIEQLRFQDRLQVKLDIDPPTLDHPVPNLLLQPLVENAIKHGLAARPGVGLIEIETKLAANELQLQIRDNGSGVAENGQVHDGIGLSSTRERLAQMYGTQARLTLRNRASGGLEVAITIPRKL